MTGPVLPGTSLTRSRPAYASATPSSSDTSNALPDQVRLPDLCDSLAGSVGLPKSALERTGESVAT